MGSVTLTICGEVQHIGPTDGGASTPLDMSPHWPSSTLVSVLRSELDRWLSRCLSSQRMDSRVDPSDVWRKILHSSSNLRCGTHSQVPPRSDKRAIEVSRHHTWKQGIVRRGIKRQMINFRANWIVCVR